MHGNPSTRKCDICKVYGMMPRFGTYKCSKGHKTTVTKPKSKIFINYDIIGYKWIGWFK